ncbi:DUF6571 family protein [Actinomyces wuliandei]|uniref:DUF6571 family protein n=1 Tax=Actinomyces wuliandei TaxID=2057743 RepID=UPI000FDC9559|nr:DUF6571 family protein [Actinomyces wuliandei]
MVFVSLDPEKLLSYVVGLELWAAMADTERLQVRARNVNRVGEPVVESVEWKTLPGGGGAWVGAAAGGGGGGPVPVGAGAGWGQAVVHLQEVAHELRTRRQEAVDMNSQGVTMATPEGRVCYYLPDGAEDTAANVVAYNSLAVAGGRGDATALNQARRSPEGVAEDGRTVEQVLAEMAKHQDVPTYGASFVNTFGVEGFVDNVLMLQQRYGSVGSEGSFEIDDAEGLGEAVGVLGHVLAAATLSGVDPREGEGAWADQLYGAVAEEGSRGRMSALNALLASEGAVYATGTLVDLADRLEDLPYGGQAASATPDSVYGWYDPVYGAVYNEGPALVGYSMDPLYGVLSAMGSNPQAALGYLVPDGEPDDKGRWVPGEGSQERWELLGSREWDPEVGLDGLTAAQAAASSLRGGADAATAGAATWATARSMEMAVNEVSLEDYTEVMKENLSLLVANSAQEAVQVAKDQNPVGLGLEGGSAEAKSVVTSLMYRVVDNGDAAVTMAAAMANQALGAEASTPEELHSKYEAAAAAQAYLGAVGSERVADLEAQAASEAAGAREAAGTAVSVFTTVAGAGVGAVTSGPAAPLVWSLGTTLARPVVVEALAPETVEVLDNPAAGSRSLLEAYAYAEAANSGFLPEEALAPERFVDPATGEPYPWYHEPGSGDGPVVDLPAAPSDDVVSAVRGWAESDDVASLDEDHVLMDSANAIDRGDNAGGSRIENRSEAGGRDGDLRIDKG